MKLRLHPDQDLSISEIQPINPMNGRKGEKFSLDKAEIQHQAVVPLIRELTGEKARRILGVSIEDGENGDLAKIYLGFNNSINLIAGETPEARELSGLFVSLSKYQKAGKMPEYKDRLPVYDEIRDGLKIKFERILELLRTVAEKLKKTNPAIGALVGEINNLLVEELVADREGVDIESLKFKSDGVGEILDNIVALNLPVMVDSGNSIEQAIA